jgi:Ca-activated chloride channel homolog
MILSAQSQRLVLLSSCCLLGVLPLFSLGGNSPSPQMPPAPPQIARQSTISVETELVVLPVRVTDTNGDFVPGLALDDFRVYEEGLLQKITLFQQEDTPVTVGLVVDHSRSMGPKLPEVSAAVSGFARSSNTEDEMFVVDFNDSVSLELAGGKPFTNNAEELERAVGAVSARGQTALYDAVLEGLAHLRLAHWDKKALIVVSDGGDNASHSPYADVLALARRSQAVIYCIGLVGGVEEENPGALRRLCKDTGGLAYFPSSSETVADVSAKIARDLREQYTLGFVPEKASTGKAFRRIQVRVSAPGRGKIRVRARLGYFAAEQTHCPAPSRKNAS